MKSCYYLITSPSQVWKTVLLPALMLLTPIQSLADSAPVAVINSDHSIPKYTVIEDNFLQGLNVPSITLNLASDASAPEKTHDSNVIFTIGSNALQAFAPTVTEKPLVFAGILNWQRFSAAHDAYGVAHELPAEMQLYMVSYLFPEIRKLGILYNDEYNGEWFQTAHTQAQDIGLSLQGGMVDSPERSVEVLTGLLGDVDALWLIADPTVLYNAEAVKTFFQHTRQAQKPVFTYSPVFLQYGAILSISADIPTMGRQAAAIARDLLRQRPMSDRVQPPAGSSISLDLGEARRYGLKVNPAALSSVEKIIR